MSEKIEVRNLTPVIATISAGKTSLLNAIFNIKFLEVSSHIGTKFVNIIRYNSKRGKVPIFYHLIVKKIGNSENYDFYKDNNSVVTGSENIAKKNAEINMKLKQKNAPFEEIFYMTEVGEVSLIKDEEYLKNYDLVDIPGLSEYLPSEEENEIKANNLSDAPSAKNNIQKYYYNKSKRKEFQENMKVKTNNEENSYLKGIFTIIKNKVNNGIIIFDSTNLGREENFVIIEKFYKIIKRPIENFLILLNKIDERKNFKEDIDNLKTKIFEFNPNGTYFNYTNNTLLPCSTYSLRNEINMEKNFKYLMCFYFYNYNLKKKKDDETFLDYLKNILFVLENENNYEKSEIIDKIEKFLSFPNLPDIIEEIKNSIIKIKKLCQNNNLKMGLLNEEKFNKNEIEGILAKLKDINSESDSDDEKNIKRKEIIKIRDLKPDIIIICYYLYFKEKQNIPPISITNKKIIEYFTMENMTKVEDNYDDYIQNNATINLEKALKKLKIFYSSYKVEYVNKSEKIYYNIYNNNYKEIEKDLNIISQQSQKFKNFYLPIVGLNNAGKSIILNNIIGYNLLPTGLEITTKKGILIRHWDKDYPEIHKVKFQQYSLDNLFKYESCLGKGVQNVKDLLKNINANFANNKDDFFYEVYTKIKFFEENKIAETLKDKICFIDLPGYGTKYGFEKSDIHSELIKCCDLVVFVFDILKKENNRNILNTIIEELKKNFKNKGSLTDAALQYRFLFINNRSNEDDKSNSLKKQNKDYQNYINELKFKAKQEIIDIFGKTFSNPNVCILNSKNYYDYMENLNKFELTGDFLKTELEKYDMQKEDFYKGIVSAKGLQKSFRRYLNKILDDEFEKAKNSSTITEEKLEQEYKKKESDEEVEKIVKKYFEKDIKTEKLKAIILLLSKIKYLYNHSIYLSNSYYELFSKDLKIFILFGEKTKGKFLMDNLNSVLNRLNMIFFYPIGKKKPKLTKKKEKQPEFSNLLNNFDNTINDLLKNMHKDLRFNDKNNIRNSLESCLNKLRNTLNEQKKYINKNLTEKEIKDVFDKKTKDLKETFKKVADNYSRTAHYYYNKIKEKFEFFSQYFEEEEIEKLEKLFKNINYKTFKVYLKESLDNFNDKNIESVLEDMINEILEGVRECTYYKNSKGIFDWLLLQFSSTEYLYRIIDYMYENSEKKFNSFIETADNVSFDYYFYLSNSLEKLKDNYKQIFESLVINEKRKIDEINLENEEKEKLYNEEIKKYELEREEWINTCNRYKIIEEEFGKYLSEINDYLIENIERVLLGISKNDNE